MTPLKTKRLWGSERMAECAQSCANAPPPPPPLCSVLKHPTQPTWDTRHLCANIQTLTKQQQNSRRAKPVMSMFSERRKQSLNAPCVKMELKIIRVSASKYKRAVNNSTHSHTTENKTEKARIGLNQQAGRGGAGNELCVLCSWYISPFVLRGDYLVCSPGNLKSSLGRVFKDAALVAACPLSP